MESYGESFLCLVRDAQTSGARGAAERFSSYTSALHKKNPLRQEHEKHLKLIFLKTVYCTAVIQYSIIRT